MHRLKSLWLQFIFISFLGISSCSTAKFTAETRSVKPAESTQIEVVSGGYGATKKTASQNAVENAFKTLLMYGVPNSNQETPLLGSNAEQKFLDQQAFFDNFLASSLDNFIVSKKVRGYKFTNSKTPSTEVSMLINLHSVRNHLIANNIISDFGL